MATFTDEELVENYHDARCPGDGSNGCRAHDLHWNWSTREMLDRINETRRAVGAQERDPEGHRGV